MSDIIRIGKGITAFIAGSIGIILLNYMLPELFTVGEEIFESTDIQIIGWLATIIVYIMFAIVYPTYQNYSSLTEGKDELPPFMKIFFGIILFILTIFMTIKGQYFITAISDEIATYTFTYVLFWLGLVIMWLQYTIILPAYLIIEGTR